MPDGVESQTLTLPIKFTVLHDLENVGELGYLASALKLVKYTFYNHDPHFFDELLEFE